MPLYLIYLGKKLVTWTNIYLLKYIAVTCMNAFQYFLQLIYYRNSIIYVEREKNKVPATLNEHMTKS